MSPPSPSPARTSHAGGEPFACAPGAGDEPLGVRCRRANGKLPGRSGCAGGQPLRACAKCANFHRQLSLSPRFLLPQRPASPNPHCSTRASPARWRAMAAQPCGGDRSEAWPPCISSSRQTAPRQEAGIRRHRWRRRRRRVPGSLSSPGAERRSPHPSRRAAARGR